MVDQYIKIYGLLRSGTNWTIMILRKNFKNCVILPNDLQEKHRYPLVPDFSNTKQKIIQARDENRLSYLLITKNPYNWVRSHVEFNKYDLFKIMHPSFNIEDEFQKHIKNWNDAMTEFMIFKKNNYENTFIMNYESLLFDFDTTIDKLKNFFKLQMRFNEYKKIENTVYPNAKTDPYIFNKKRSTLHEALKKLPDSVIKNINKTISDSLFNYFDYRKVDI